jgi:hypothetical protein
MVRDLRDTYQVILKKKLLHVHLTMVRSTEDTRKRSAKRYKNTLVVQYATKVTREAERQDITIAPKLERETRSDKARNQEAK